MSKKALQQKDVIVKLIVGAGQASPSPPVGPALGSKGVKSMDFCKVCCYDKRPLELCCLVLMNVRQEFNARTANYVPGTPIPARVTVRPDRSFTFELRTPPTSSLLFAAANVQQKKSKIRGAGNAPGPNNNREGAHGKANPLTSSAGNSGVGIVGTVSLKHVYEIARIKQSELRLSGLSLEGLAKSVVAQAGSIGVVVVP